MSYWPRLELTPEEAQYYQKYSDPDSGKKGVLRNIYQGHLETNDVNSRPLWNFQIARRCRVFAFTGIGDVGNIRIQFQDATGEQYFVQPQLAAAVFGGGNNSQLQTITGTVAPVYCAPLMQWAASPFVFEPNIVLRANQVLNIIGEAVRPYDGFAYRIDFAIHVWEFDNYPT